MAIGHLKNLLVIARLDVLLLRQDPDLQEVDLIGRAAVVLRVGQARPGGHDLHLASANDLLVAGRVFMGELPPQGDRDDLHIVVRVRAETHRGRHDVVVQDAKHSEVDTFGLEVAREAKGMAAFQPAVVCVASGIGFVQDGFARGGDRAHGLKMIRFSNLYV